MKKLIILAALLLIAITGLFAQKMALDLNGYPIQLGRYFTTERDTMYEANGTVYDSIAVPSNAVEVYVVPRYEAVYIYGGPAKTLAKAAVDWVYVPEDCLISLPVNDVTYIKFKSVTKGATINFIWKRM